MESISAELERSVEVGGEREVSGSRSRGTACASSRGWTVTPRGNWGQLLNAQQEPCLQTVKFPTPWLSSFSGDMSQFVHKSIKLAWCSAFVIYIALFCNRLIILSPRTLTKMLKTNKCEK